ncbi:DUF2236 domain-containing protein [Fibrella sp. HMF5335]|uniref:DUF2236 domain-containing protein n=1 Tax=Fibrella rubiginis TaxID=2817060 RepID=A0A939GIS1_9BACT|nr:DUF5995 family protein [Fibrella rubiginis]MBO0937203.1 DUF2236 domain-containing protein [Fibrella rubiginis]
MTTSETTPKLYALLVGVGAYERVRQLRGPVGDVQVLTKYLQNQTDFDLKLLALTDQQANKKGIINGFQNHLAQAGPADTVLFYFSGHGAQEAADTAVWDDEADGQLECLVCHDGGTVNPWEFLLADKEVRYLLGPVCATGAHVVVMADCCHAGDNTRAVDLLAMVLPDQDVRERRLTEPAPRRPYEGFIFHETLPAAEIQTKGLDVVMPQGNHVQFAACESEELAEEFNGEGIFTKNLLAVLNATHGQVSYRDLHSRVRQYMRFGYEQRPRVYVPDGQDAAVLERGFLNRQLEQNALTVSATFNPQKGWLLDVGAIHGMASRPADGAISLYDAATKTAYPASVKQVGADYTVLTVADDVAAKLDQTAVYRTTVAGLMSQPVRLHMVNHGGPSADQTDLLQRLMSRPKLDGQAGKPETVFVAEDDETRADYTLHVRNGLFYITKPGDENRPLIRPLRADNAQAIAILADYLHHLSGWQYLKNLHNSTVSEPVLAVELTLANAAPLTITDPHTAPIPVVFSEQDGKWSTTLAIKLTNPANQPVYCTALYLSRDFMAFPDFLPTNCRLEAGQSVTLGAASKKVPMGRQSTIRLGLEEVVRQYNWPGSTEHIKLLVTTDPLSETTLALLTMSALPSPPVLTDKLRPTDARGGFDLFDDEAEPLPDWSTQTLTLQLTNPLYNTVRAEELSQMLAPPPDAQHEDIMADFALGLYYEPDLSNPMAPGLKLREGIHVIEPDAGQRGLWTDLTLAVANGVAKRVRNRQYEQSLIRYPDRLRIVAEGDSWFQYPFLLRDILDYLGGVYNVYSVAAAGATLEDYLKDSTFLESIDQVKPAYFLLSGGGNDLLGEAFAGLIRTTPDADQTGAIRYFTDAFATTLTTVCERYRRILRLVNLGHPNVKIIVHGYDYVIPRGTDASLPGTSSWMGDVLNDRGVMTEADRESIARFIIDSFNDALKKVAAEYPNVTYLDLRGTVQRTARLADYWYDEIHPNDKGFLSLSTKFIEVISGKKTPQNAPKTPTISGPGSVRAVADQPSPAREATPPTAAQSTPVTRWPAAFLQTKRGLGDPLADEVITTLLADNQKGEVDQIFQMLVRNRQFPNPAFDVLPDKVKQVVEGYFVQTRHLPAYAEPFKLMVAADVFTQHGPKILLILLCKSLPTCYTCWRGAKVLYRTGRLRAHDGSLDAFSRRLMETAQFVVDMMTTNNFEQDGTAIVATQKVRLMHATIRHFAQERNWDSAAFGVPINQEDLVGTLLSFGVVILDGLAQLGITLTPEQRAAYLHLWRVVGHMMGIDEDLLTDDEDECRALMEAILAHQSGPSMEGAELTQACIELMNSKLVIGPLKRLTPSFVRFFVSDSHADMLGVAPAESDNSFIMKTVQWFDNSVRGLDNTNLLMAAMGRAFSSNLIGQILAFTNAAKNEQFYLPSALTDRWEANMPDFRVPPLEHIADVISYLDKVARQFRSQNNPMGYFCAVYKLVTQRVAEGIRIGLFANPVEMEQVDVAFSNRYFTAINHFFDGEKATGPWQVTIDAAQTTITTDQHIFAAASAHIAFDLPIVMADVYAGKDLDAFTADYNKMNDLFDGMFDQMNDNIGRIFKPFGAAVEHFAEELKAKERAAMQQSRTVAWQKAKQLLQAQTDIERQQLIATLEAEATAAGKQITEPPALLRIPLELIAKSEFGTVANKVDVMLRTAMLPVVA